MTAKDIRATGGMSCMDYKEDCFDALLIRGGEILHVDHLDYLPVES
jgi:hypothetical protein